MRNKITEHSKSGYSSSPHQFTDTDIDIIIENNCQCYNCQKSIFEMWDFPEVLEEEREVLCEECYDEQYRDICPICEDYYEIKEVKGDTTPFPKSPFFYYNPADKDEDKSNYSENYQQPSGVYETVKYPVFVAACGGLGDTWIQWENVQLICTSDEFLAPDSSESYKEFFTGDNIKAQFVCDSCWGNAVKIREAKLGKEVHP